MSSDSHISRRRFLGASAGVAGIAAMGPFAARGLGAGQAGGVGERLVPPGKLSIQHFSIRDAASRLDRSVMGRLGGPNFPADPTDLGPEVPLPGGFPAVFEYLASLGYRGFEFFQFSQNQFPAGDPRRTPSFEQIRSWLDAAGLASTGTHTGGLATMVNPVTRQQQIDIAHTLGHTMIGTAGDPVGGAGAALLANWQTAAANYDIVGAALAAEGMRYYLHAEQNNFNFFNDPAHPELSRVHRIDWFTENTDPSLVFFEPDILHSYAGRARFPDPVDGSMWDALGYWTANAQRIVGWHIKDGSRISPQPAPPANPFTQTVLRAPGFTDVIYAGEGSIGQGFPIDPDPAVVGFRRIFADVGAKGSHAAIIESDSAIGGATDPGRSLRHAKISIQNVLGLRGGGLKPLPHSTAVEDAAYESDAEYVS